MANFSYTARNPQEQIVKGTVSAASREAAMQTIIKQGLKPILVKEEGGSGSKRGKNLLSFNVGKVKAMTSSYSRASFLRWLVPEYL
jgi:type II secretory pathway component PulF